MKHDGGTLDIWLTGQASDCDAVGPSRRPASVKPEDRRVQIAAAKARITLDRLTGDPTLEWIIALSKEQPE